jgi:hypothetical protein
LPNHKKKQEKCGVATKVSFVETNQPFVDRLDTFSIARLLEITLVLLFFGEIHCLLSLRASLDRDLTQGRFSSVPIGQILMQKRKRPCGSSRPSEDQIDSRQWISSENNSTRVIFRTLAMEKVSNRSTNG